MKMWLKSARLKDDDASSDAEDHWRIVAMEGEDDRWQREMRCE